MRPRAAVRRRRRRLSLRAAVPLVALLAAASAGVGIPVPGSYGAHVAADEPQYLLSALSLAEDGDLDIADELADERWRVFHEADLPQQTRPLAAGGPAPRHISPHDPLLPLLLAPGMRLYGWVGAKLTLVALAGLLAALTCTVAVRRFAVPVPAAGLVTAVFAASAPLAVYGQQVYPEVPAALATTIAVGALAGPLRARGIAVLAAAVVALPWLAVKYVPVAGVLAALGLWRLVCDRRRLALSTLLGLLVTAAIVYAGAHAAIYGGLTSYAAGDHFVSHGEFSAVGFRPNPLGRSRRLVGLLVDAGFGLAAWQPAWLLAVPAVAALARRRPPGWHLLLAPLAAGWLTAVFVALTMHGWWFPGRQTVVVLPLAVIVVGRWVGGHPRRHLALALLGATGLWMYAWLVLQGFGRRLTWAVDPFASADPLYQSWRVVLPDGLQDTTGSMLLLAVWALLLGVLAFLAWRAEGASASAARG